jgi:hypothetical protein
VAHRESRHPCERRDREALAAGHDQVLAQLERAAGDADNHQSLEHSVVRVGERVAVDQGDA